MMTLIKSMVSPQFQYFVQLCFSSTLKGCAKINVEGRTTMVIKVISRIFK